VPACYRLFRRKYSPADATGAYLAGGRWNPKGIHMLYASSTLSLACLEILVHIKEPRFPFDYEWVKIDIPAGLIDRPFRMPVSDDEDLRRQLGSEWIRAGHRPVMKAPSVVIPIEKNFLINPEHPAFGDLSFSEPEPDPRLLKLRPMPM
jgi:RES domain-containing protein